MFDAVSSEPNRHHVYYRADVALRDDLRPPDAFLDPMSLLRRSEAFEAEPWHLALPSLEEQHYGYQFP